MKNLRPRTKDSYLMHVVAVGRHYGCDPAALSERQIGDFLVILRSERKYAAARRNLRPRSATMLSDSEPSRGPVARIAMAVRDLSRLGAIRHRAATLESTANRPFDKAQTSPPPPPAPPPAETMCRPASQTR